MIRGIKSRMMKWAGSVPHMGVKFPHEKVKARTARKKGG
jgi:hypothetical protein